MLELSTAMSTARAEVGDEVGRVQECLTFMLGTEEYAIDILKVQEIRGYDAVTTIANAPPFIKGVINLRGTIVPIVDMRIRGCRQDRIHAFHRRHHPQCRRACGRHGGR